eukprot:g222.t1
MLLSVSRPLLGGLGHLSMAKCTDNCGIVKVCITAIGKQKKCDGAHRKEAPQTETGALGRENKNQRVLAFPLEQSLIALRQTVTVVPPPVSIHGAIGQRARAYARDKNEAYWGPRKLKCLIVRRRGPTNRRDGSQIKFDDNAVVVIRKNKCLGTKIKGPVAYEMRHSSKALARWIF